MTDEGARTPDEDETPWWSRPAGDPWQGSPAPAAPAAPVDEPTTRVPAPDQSSGAPRDAYGAPSDSYGAPDASTTPLYGAEPGAFGGYPQHPSAQQDTRSIWEVPAEHTDTIGNQRGSAPGRRTSLVVVAALLIALVAGGIGGAVGFALADRSQGSVTIDGADLGAAPARTVERPEGSVAGVAAKVLPSVVQIKVSTSQGNATGSGFVIDKNGLIVTNNHVVAGANGPVHVVFANSTETDATVVGRSPSYDLAVIRVRAKNLTPLPLGNSDSVVVGDPVIAIGSPLGLSGTVTSGIISAKDRPVTAGEQGANENSYINAVQTDAAINPGNSGGPLVDLDGEVIGVNSAIATLGGGGLSGESGSIGVGFAIPINQARRTVEQLINKGEAQFPIIGASLDGRYTGPGARIATQAASDGTPPLIAGGPADKAGLHPGDVITAIDGKKVEGSAELIVAIRSHRPGETVTLTVKRGGDETAYRVTLAATKG